MLKWLFGKRAAPVVMNLQEIRDRLELDHERFGPDPKNHIPVLDALGEYTLRGSSFFGPARTFYTNPDKTVTIKGAPSQFSDVPDPGDEQVQSAAFVSYTEQTRGFGKRNFALIIRQGANTVEEMENSLAFGLFGLFDKQGNMTVKKIIMPGKDVKRNAHQHVCPNNNCRDDDVADCAFDKNINIKQVMSGNGIGQRGGKKN